MDNKIISEEQIMYMSSRSIPTTLSKYAQIKMIFKLVVTTTEESHKKDLYQL